MRRIRQMLRRKAGQVAPQPEEDISPPAQVESGPSVPAGGEEAHGQGKGRSCFACWRRRKTAAPLADPEAPSGPKRRCPRVQPWSREPGEGRSRGRQLWGFLFRKPRIQELRPRAQQEPPTIVAAEGPCASPTLAPEEPPAGTTLAPEKPPAGSTLATEEPPAGTTLAMEEPPAGTTLATEEPPAGTTLAPEKPPAGTILVTEKPPASTTLATEEPPASTTLAPEKPPAGTILVTEKPPASTTLAKEEPPASPTLATEEPPASPSLATQKPPASPSLALVAPPPSPEQEFSDSTSSVFSCGSSSSSVGSGSPVFQGSLFGASLQALQPPAPALPPPPLDLPQHRQFRPPSFDLQRRYGLWLRMCLHIVNTCLQ
ncbi:fibrous sheath CABYR-binding protein-like [Mauremys mutica]|uniref:fibrous sheath CABYR-binding protein-like n=1 Tax=Mauremys mutica TaxID=74926 RepID=UPI001D16ACB3|nr:fibrous sheath CABYR-binding protein-like [Mauremys mutica]XP_044850180.1 fibrous sheath CABYR-binding protein-like [Mauremys mutica]XP_044850181.1 fibrous sheath CABYR-binding protein-like [Mauremys mutica]XP_044850182.1 fibrous sheath CABYR-binding protein-like [Mauremys mutica]XP_044850183.1 fibrous sheath CABYR-binding protein-like [Mauremys mutica]